LKKKEVSNFEKRKGGRSLREKGSKGGDLRVSGFSGKKILEPKGNEKGSQKKAKKKKNPGGRGEGYFRSSGGKGKGQGELFKKRKNALTVLLKGGEGN